MMLHFLVGITKFKGAYFNVLFYFKGDYLFPFGFAKTSQRSSAGALLFSSRPGKHFIITHGAVRQARRPHSAAELT